MFRLPLFLAAGLVLAATAGAGAALDSYQVAQLYIERVTIRIPRLPSRPVSLTRAPVTWTERKGPKCLDLKSVAGATITQEHAVDFVGIGGGRIRARLDRDCRALDFESGFYFRASKDGRICADRDSVRSRAGRVCEIERFRTLVAAR